MADENEKKVVSFGKAGKVLWRQMDDPWIEILHVSSVSKKMAPCSFRTTGIRLEDAGDDASLLILQSGETIRVSLPYVALMEKIYEGYSPIDLKEYCDIVIPPPKAGDKMADGSVFVGLTDDGKQQIYAMPMDLDITMTFNDAAKAVKNLNGNKALGHDDWQIPVLENVRILQKNQNEGSLKGTFKIASANNWYWSSKESHDSASVHGVLLSDGYECLYNKNNFLLDCRPVRLVAV